MNKTDCEFTTLLQQLCAEDEYRLRDMKFTPDVILDIGANIGVFAGMARYLYPNAEIISVEPDPRAWEMLEEFTCRMPRVTRINAAIGTGPIWLHPQDEIVAPYYGVMQQYFTMGQLGASDAAHVAQHINCYRAHDVDVIRLDELVKEHVGDNDKLLLKIDIEGGEQCFFGHAPSWKALRRADYLTMELHFRTYGTGPEHESVRNRICYDLMTLGDSHDCTLDVIYNHFFAMKK